MGRALHKALGDRVLVPAPLIGCMILQPLPRASLSVSVKEGHAEVISKVTYSVSIIVKLPVVYLVFQSRLLSHRFFHFFDS